MSMLQRIKGQESYLSVFADGNFEDKIECYKDSEWTFDFDVLEQGLLGERSNRYDSIFKGIAVKATGQLTSGRLIRLAHALVQRAGREPGAGIVRVDMAVTLAFPGGDQLSISALDLSFGPIPINFGGRDQFVEWTFDAKASRYKLV